MRELSPKVRDDNPRRSKDVGFVLRLAFNGLVAALVLFGLGLGVVLAATGDSSGPRRVVYFAIIACLEIIVGTVGTFAARTKRPSASQKLRVLTWWLLPLNVVVLYLLAL